MRCSYTKSFFILYLKFKFNSFFYFYLLKLTPQLAPSKAAEGYAPSYYSVVTASPSLCPTGPHCSLYALNIHTHSLFWTLHLPCDLPVSLTFLCSQTPDQPGFRTC